MAHINISVPDDLRERMRELKNPPNWSALVQAAIWKVVAAPETYRTVSEPIANNITIHIDVVNLNTPEEGNQP